MPIKFIENQRLLYTAMSAKAKAKTKAPPLSDQEIQQNYVRLQNELQALARKIGELESESDEHTLVLSTLEQTLSEDPNRKCFRLIGGVLVERTVREITPALKLIVMVYRRSLQL